MLHLTHKFIQQECIIARERFGEAIDYKSFCEKMFASSGLKIYPVQGGNHNPHVRTHSIYHPIFSDLPGEFLHLILYYQP